ncbi:hypothetical protein ACSP9K_002243 [Citrobacter werkmanii]
MLHGLKEAPELFRIVIPFTGANLVTRRATETVAEVILFFCLLHQFISLALAIGRNLFRSILPDGLQPALPKALLLRDRNTAPDDKVSDAAPDPCVTLTAKSRESDARSPLAAHQRNPLHQTIAGF